MSINAIKLYVLIWMMASVCLANDALIVSAVMSDDCESIHFFVKNTGDEVVDFNESSFASPNLSLLIIDSTDFNRVIRPNRFPESRWANHRLELDDVIKLDVSLRNRFPKDLFEVRDDELVLVWMVRAFGGSRLLGSGTIVLGRGEKGVISALSH